MTRTTINIEKAKISNGTFLVADYQELIPTEHGVRTDKNKGKESDAYIHEDLKSAFKKLTKHLIHLTEYGRYNEVINDEIMLSKFEVTGIIPGGEDEQKGVQLIGKRLLGHGQVLNLLTPFTKYHPEHSSYKDDDTDYCSILQSEVGVCLAECILHITNQKVGVNPQGSLFEKPGPKQDEEEGADEESEKKPSPRARQRKLEHAV